MEARGGRALGVAIALLVVSNVAANRLLPTWAYVPWNATVAFALVAVALRSGLTRSDLGLDAGGVRRGWRIGRWFLALTALGYCVGLLLPGTRGWLEDDRVRTLGWIEVVYHALVAVPLGTVLLEETAFRGVLPALAERLTSRRRATLFASVLFGVWHVLPAWAISDTNPVLRASLHGRLGQAIAVVIAVASTTLVGLFFSWLRYRSASLLTTMFLHLASNSLGYLAAFVAWSVH